MIKGVFIFIGIMVAGFAIGEGEILGAIVCIVVCTLIGEGLERLIVGKEEKQTGKIETTEPDASSSVEEEPENAETNFKTVEPEKSVEEEAKEWKCPECGNINNSEFCEECGTKKPVIPAMKNKFCTNCGAKLEEGQKFCEECGTKVEFDI
jgi:hypothetical protein